MGLSVVVAFFQPLPYQILYNAQFSRSHWMSFFWYLCRREVYDKTGSLEDSEGLAGEQFDNLYEYYRNVYKKVTVEDIEAVETEYRGSSEEQEDVLKYYTQFKGDMDKARFSESLSFLETSCKVDQTSLCETQPFYRENLGFCRTQRLTPLCPEWVSRSCQCMSILQVIQQTYSNYLDLGSTYQSTQAWFWTPNTVQAFLGSRYILFCQCVRKFSGPKHCDISCPSNCFRKEILKLHRLCKTFDLQSIPLSRVEK